MKYLKFSAAFAFLLLVACDKNNVYSKFDKDFDDNRWLQTDVRTYDFEITAASQSYDLLLDFSHIAGFQFNNIPIEVTLTNPDQTPTTQTVLLQIIDAEGKELGDCDGDYCDILQPVFKNKKLAAGKYHVAIANKFNGPYLPNVLGFGIKVNLSENK